MTTYSFWWEILIGNEKQTEYMTEWTLNIKYDVWQDNSRGKLENLVQLPFL